MYVDVPTLIVILLLLKSYIVVIFITWWLCKGKKRFKKFLKYIKE